MSDQSFDIELEVEDTSDPSVDVSMAEGPPGPPGPPGSASGTYVHVQSVPSLVWTISHNLGTYPQFMVLDEDENQMFGWTPTWPSENVSVLAFPTPKAGTCYAS